MYQTKLASSSSVRSFFFLLLLKKISHFDSHPKTRYVERGTLNCLAASSNDILPFLISFKAFCMPSFDHFLVGLCFLLSPIFYNKSNDKVGQILIKLVFQNYQNFKNSYLLYLQIPFTENVILIGNATTNIESHKCLFFSFSLVLWETWSFWKRI